MGCVLQSFTMEWNQIIYHFLKTPRQDRTIISPGLARLYYDGCDIGFHRSPPLCNGKLVLIETSLPLHGTFLLIGNSSEIMILGGIRKLKDRNRRARLGALMRIYSRVSLSSTIFSCNRTNNWKLTRFAMNLLIEINKSDCVLCEPQYNGSQLKWHSTMTWIILNWNRTITTWPRKRAVQLIKNS